MSILIALAMLPGIVTGQGQIAIRRIGLLPDRPSPYQLRDWNKTAHDYGQVALDTKATGATYLPLIWRVPGAPNLTGPGFGMPSYVGGETSRGTAGESIASLGTLFGATLAGIDVQSWVELTPQYLNPKEGVILNNPGKKSGDSFWYDLLPSVVFTQLASKYPKWSRGQEISKTIADAWLRATEDLDGNFEHTGYHLGAGTPSDNGQWKEPDAAAAVAYLELFQALKSGESTYFHAARKALRGLGSQGDNPTYEVLTAYGALTAAYLNAMHGDKWDDVRMVDWCFDPTSPNRVGWGMVVGNWGGYDVGGLMGSTNDGGGYAFAMNTFVNLGTLAPVCRYDPRLSADMAKWILNASNAARLFYKDSLDAEHQSGRAWTGDPNAGIAYEALRKTWEGKSPYAAGDAKRSGWAKEDFGLYGGGYVGLLGALVHPTNVPEILRIDLRATDCLPTKGFPTDLLWNPYDTEKTVRLDLGPEPVRPFDAVRNEFLSFIPNSGRFDIKLRPKQAVQIVRVPGVHLPFYKQNRIIVDGIPIGFNNGRVPLPPHKGVVHSDASVRVKASRVADGKPDWSLAEPIKLVAGAGGTTRADLRFAWDEHYLYFQLTQTAKATETVEAPSVAELRRHRWDFEHVELMFDPSRDKFALTSVPEASIGWGSKGLANLAYSDDMPEGAIETTTSGTSDKSDRVIEGRIAWSALYKAFGTNEPLSNIVRRGSEFGCQPLMTDGSFRRQAYLNGKPYTRPTGFDKDSRTIVLQ